MNYHGRPQKWIFIHRRKSQGLYEKSCIYERAHVTSTYLKELKKRRFFPCGRNFERVKVKVSTLEIERERKRVNLPKKKKISNPRVKDLFEEESNSMIRNTHEGIIFNWSGGKKQSLMVIEQVFFFY